MLVLNKISANCKCLCILLVNIFHRSCSAYREICKKSKSIQVIYGHSLLLICDLLVFVLDDHRPFYNVVYVFRVSILVKCNFYIIIAIASSSGYWESKIINIFYYVMVIFGKCVKEIIVWLELMESLLKSFRVLKTNKQKASCLIYIGWSKCFLKSESMDKISWKSPFQLKTSKILSWLGAFEL